MEFIVTGAVQSYVSARGVFWHNRMTLCGHVSDPFCGHLVAENRVVMQARIRPDPIDFYILDADPMIRIWSDHVIGFARHFNFQHVGSR